MFRLMYVQYLCNMLKKLTAGSKLVIGLFLRVFYILNAIVIHAVIKLYNNLGRYKDPNYLFIICMFIYLLLSLSFRYL